MQDIFSIKSGSCIVIPNNNSDNRVNYDFAVFGMSLGVTGVVLSIMSMTKKRDKLF